MLLLLGIMLTMAGAGAGARARARDEEGACLSCSHLSSTRTSLALPIDSSLAQALRPRGLGIPFFFLPLRAGHTMGPVPAFSCSGV